MRKENAQRLKHDLPRGQFYLTLRTASNDLNLSFSKIQRLIRKFVELEIIDDIFTHHTVAENLRYISITQ